MIFFDILKSVVNYLTLKLTFQKHFVGKTIKMDDDKSFAIIRHMKLKKGQSDNRAVLVIRFKFSKYSHRKNIKLSCIPMFIIAGFKGFGEKIWMIDYKEGCWQGVYSWDSVDAIEKYKKSTVLGIMNKRALNGTVSYTTLESTKIEDFIKERIVKE